MHFIEGFFFKIFFLGENIKLNMQNYYHYSYHKTIAVYSRGEIAVEVSG
jgi:hypothetical protein